MFRVNARCLQIFSHKNQPSAVTHGKIYAAFRSSNIKNWIFKFSVLAKSSNLRHCSIYYYNPVFVVSPDKLNPKQDEFF